MADLREIDFKDATVIEHRATERVVGHASYGGVNGDGSVGIGWAHGVHHRTTVFRPSNWSVEVSENVVFLDRKADDPHGEFDLPWRDAQHYTVILRQR